jgi:hypothetical protein
VLPDDAGIGLDFGAVPTDRPVEFTDVLRLASVADKTAKLEFVVSGLPDGAVQVGFWDDTRGLVTNGLTLKAGEEVRIAVAFALPGAQPAGLLEGKLTVTAQLPGGTSQQQDLPLALTATPAQAEPAGSPSPGPSESPFTASRRQSSPAVASGLPWRPLVRLLVQRSS